MKILILGMAPLPGQRARHHSAPGLRTWQLTRPLLERGHQVCLVTFGQAGGGQRGARQRWPSLRQVRLDADAFTDGQQLCSVCAQFGPDAVVAASSYQCTLAAMNLSFGGPLWIDLPGDLMAEAQLRGDQGSAARDWVADYRSVLWPALRRGDRFSVVSRRQRHALIGQLGLAGRLNPQTLGQELVAVIPAAVQGPGRTPGGKARVPWSLPDDAFVVISSGGYNTWTDVQTLAQGLRLAMDREPRLHFVSAGGAIAGHHEQGFELLKQAATASPHAHRMHLPGWLWPADLARLYARAQLGLNLDRPCYEAELGSRNRLLDWLRYGVLPVTTTCTELAATLARQGAALVVPPGDPEALARCLVGQATRGQELAAAGQQGRQLVLQQFSYEATTLPLRGWAAQPQRAGDAGQRILPGLAPGEDLAAELRRLRIQLRATRASPAFWLARRGGSLVRRIWKTLYPKD